jgi:hypothetical protein
MQLPIILCTTARILWKGMRINIKSTYAEDEWLSLRASLFIWDEASAKEWCLCECNIGDEGADNSLHGVRTSSTSDNDREPWRLFFVRENALLNELRSYIWKYILISKYSNYII